MTSGGGERVLDRHLNMLVPFVVGRRVIDCDVFVRWNCKPDVNMEVAAATMFVAGFYHCYAASNDMAIVLFQPLYFTFDPQRAQPPTDRILQTSFAAEFA